MTEKMPEVLISEEEIHAKVEELARRISADYRDVEDLILSGSSRALSSSWPTSPAT